MTAAEIGRRPVGEADLPFLFQIYASTRAAELAMTPWTDEQKHIFVSMQFQAQLDGYASAYPGAVHEIITAAAQPAGRLYLARRADCLHILDITIAPEFRNAGIGSLILREIMEDGHRENLPITIYIESFNPSLNLFLRLGFQMASQDNFQLLLKRPPSRANDEKAATSE